MADLKTTINKTETLLNKVKLAKQKINKTIVRGGGITSKSLSEIPDNIKSMIKQYSKIAILDGISELYELTNKAGVIKKDINCEFQIKDFIIFLQGGYSSTNVGLHMREFNDKHYDISIRNDCNFRRRLYVEGKNTVVMDIEKDSSIKRFSLRKIIAIG